MGLLSFSSMGIESENIMLYIQAADSLVLFFETREEKPFPAQAAA